MTSAGTVESLEGERWPDPPANATDLMPRVWRLRQVPISSLTPGDLRVMLGQQVGVRFLISTAVEVLAVDPLVEADFYPGDLLVMLLRLEPEWWAAQPAVAERFSEILAGLDLTDFKLPDEVDLPGLIEAFSLSR